MIAIRAHHLLCMLEALALEPPHRRLFAEHGTLNRVAGMLRDNPEIPVKVVAGADDICLPCPFWSREKGYCGKAPEKQPEIDRQRYQMDTALLRILGWDQGLIGSARQLYGTIANQITGAAVAQEICAPCPDAAVCAGRFSQSIASTLKAFGVLMMARNERSQD